MKDQQTPLQAVATIAAKGKEFQLDIVGVDTLSGEIQETARAPNLLDQVTFHGFLPHPRLRPLVEAADLLLVSSRHEAGPVVVLEAAVAGVPTVGTCVGHIAAWAPEAAVGVAVGDDGALAGAVMKLMSDEDRRLAIARAGQQRVIEDDADATAVRVNEIYEELVAARKKNGL